MNKFAIFTIALAGLSLAACNKSTNSAAHDTFVQMCKEDPRAKEQGFDCGCQANIIDAVLKADEMDQLVNFLQVEKRSQTDALKLGQDPKYTAMFQKIAGIGAAIHDKCADPSKVQTPAPQPTAAAPAPAAASAPAAPAKK